MAQVRNSSISRIGESNAEKIARLAQIQTGYKNKQMSDHKQQIKSIKESKMALSYSKQPLREKIDFGQEKSVDLRENKSTNFEYQNSVNKYHQIKSNMQRIISDLKR